MERWFDWHFHFLFLFTIIQFGTTILGSPPLCDMSYTTPADDTLTAAPNSGWWCVADHPEAQSITSAVNQDSCYCVGWNNQNVSEAAAECQLYGGYLTDIYSSDENNLLAGLVAQAYAQVPSEEEFDLFIGLSQQGQTIQWNSICDVANTTYTNYNASNPSSLNAAYMFSSDGTWTKNSDIQNGTANGYICRINRDPCYAGKCTATQTCRVFLNCGFCEDPTTTAATTTFVAPAGASNPIPYCDPSAPSGGWYCAVDFNPGKSVSPANTLDSCFCYMKNNENQASAQASCAAQGGYLADIKSSAENDLIQQLVFIAQQKAPQLQKSCGTGWTQYQGTCYRIDQLQTDWQSSEDYCWNTYQAHLPSVHSKAEMDFLIALGNTAKKNGIKFGVWGFWVGLTILSNTNLWSDGSPVDYTMPTGVCGVINSLMQVGSALGAPVNWWALEPFIPCAHLHYFDTTVNALCKWTPTVLPMWIGLSKTATSFWNRGCEVKPLGSNYTNTIPTTQTIQVNLLQQKTINVQPLNPAGYIYNWNKTWSQQPPATYLAVGTMCRKDRNPCGLNPCNSSQYCVNNGSCSYCIPITTTTSTTSTTTTTTPTTTSTTTTATTTTTPTTTTSTTTKAPTTTTSTTTTTPTTTTSTTTTITSTTSTTSTSTLPTTSTTVSSTTSTAPPGKRRFDQNDSTK